MGKHTPGPWTIYAQPINGAGDAILELVELVQGTSKLSDTLYLINAAGKCPAVTGCGPDSEANAQLVSASPDLLSELEYAVEVIAAHLGEDHPRVIGARAAIAKATGDAP